MREQHNRAVQRGKNGTIKKVLKIIDQEAERTKQIRGLDIREYATMQNIIERVKALYKWVG